MWKRKLFFVFDFLLLFCLAGGCATMQVAREVQGGRRALNVGNPRDAIPRFEAAANLDPHYLANYSSLEVGVWTYLGRAYYEAGEKAKALESFKRARTEHDGDNFARMYLGLAMSESGGGEAGKRELDAGLRGLHHWLETASGRIEGGHYWDVGRTLRKTIVQTLDLLREGDSQWPQIAKNVRWLGQEFDEEPEKVRQDRRHDMESGSSRDGRP